MGQAAGGWSAGARARVRGVGTHRHPLVPAHRRRSPLLSRPVCSEALATLVLQVVLVCFCFQYVGARGRTGGVRGHRVFNCARATRRRTALSRRGPAMGAEPKEKIEGLRAEAWQRHRAPRTGGLHAPPARAARREGRAKVRKRTAVARRGRGPFRAVHALTHGTAATARHTYTRCVCAIKRSHVIFFSFLKFGAGGALACFGPLDSFHPACFLAITRDLGQFSHAVGPDRPIQAYSRGPWALTRAASEWPQCSCRGSCASAPAPPESFRRPSAPSAARGH
jgi:hypothetical protein